MLAVRVISECPIRYWAVLISTPFFCRFVQAEEIAVCIAQFFPCGGKPLCAFYQWDAAGMVEIHVAEINAVYILRADSQGLELAVGNVSFLSFPRKKPVTARGLLS